MDSGATSPIITRFAPSPTGYLHLGHALAAHYAFNMAKQRGGTCLLRIEDIDFTRCKPSFTQAILEDLKWLGFNWPNPVRIQSNHMNQYVEVIEGLIEKGLAYPCVLSRSEIKTYMSQHGLDVYRRGDDVSILNNLMSKPAAWRLSMSAAQDYLGKSFGQLGYMAMDEGGNSSFKSVDPRAFGDVIIGRKDIGASYHIAVTHDDHLQSVSHVIRGKDLEDQTAIHVLLQRLMGWDTPVYFHHDLLYSGYGKKLAKRAGDISLRSFREKEYDVRKIWFKIENAMNNSDSLTLCD